MNRKTLKAAERRFLESYPGGFEHPEMQALARKHRVDKRVEMAQTSFAPSRFKDVLTVTGDLTKLVGRSSLVSMFEKPRFRDVVNGMDGPERTALASAMKALLHGSQRKGFEALVEILVPHKLAKWSLVTVVPSYYRPDDEVFIKPTTAKGVIATFELEGLIYKPRPSWSFYHDYRAAILEMKAAVDPSLAPSNAAFCGFLMMSLER